MKTMRAASRKENIPPSASKSQLPRPVSSGKKTKARPAPDFNKLHKKWEEQLQNGKSCKKKPCTIVQPFDVTKPGTKFQVQEKTTVLNDIDDEFDFEGDQQALDEILQNKGLSEKKMYGRTRVDTLSMSTGKLKKKTGCTNLGKRRILGELPCDPDQLSESPVVVAKKSLAFNKEKTTQDIEFEKDPQALHSILMDEGILTKASIDDRQTFGGAVCRPSLLHHPLPARQSCISAIGKNKGTKFDVEAVLQSVRDRQQGKNTETRHLAALKSPFKPGTGTPVVIDSPFGQRVMTQNRNSIYGDYQIHPMSSPAVHMTRVSTCDSQRPIPSPAVTQSCPRPVKKEQLSDGRSVRWADVLNSYYSPCAEPKIKEKKTLFTTIDEIENEVDNCKENIEPSQQNERTYSSNDVTIVSDGQRRNESSHVASHRGSMTHTNLQEPAPDKQYRVVQSPHGQETEQSKQYRSSHASAPRRIPVGTPSKNDSEYRNCVSVTPSDKTRTFDNRVATSSLHQSGISTLPKRELAHNGTAFNPLHSNSNLKNSLVSVEATNDGYEDSLKTQGEGQVVPIGREMAMHKDETEEQDDSGVVKKESQCSKSRPARAGPDNESVEKFVGRVKKSRKRQSIVELNESLVESHVHLHKLQAETEKLQDVKEGQETEESQMNINILQQLQLIAKQQEQLQSLQKQLQEQLVAQQKSVSMTTVPLSHDSREVSSANVNNNNIQQQTGSECVVNVDMHTDNVRNNNVTQPTEDNQNISQPMSIFMSSSAVFSQTLSHSRSPCLDLTLTPSKRQPQVAVEADITPYITKTIPITAGKLPCNPQIRSPVGIKPETSSCVSNLFPTAPPLWTPLALKEVSQDQQESTLAPNLCDNDIKTCTSQVSAIDLSIKCPGDCDSPNVKDITWDQAVSPVSYQSFTPISAFRQVTSPLKVNDNKNVGSLSLRANVEPLALDLSSKKKRLSLRRTVISCTGGKYQDALLDEECALFSCRLQTVVTPGCLRYSCVNPVAKMLEEGDDMHFIPIREDSPVNHYVREGSAFSCYSPRICEV